MKWIRKALVATLASLLMMGGAITAAQPAQAATRDYVAESAYYFNLACTSGLPWKDARPQSWVNGEIYTSMWAQTGIDSEGGIGRVRVFDEYAQGYIWVNVSFYSTFYNRCGADAVGLIQIMLNSRTQQGLLTGPYLSVDGQFGPATKARVAIFQRSQGLTDDGIVGPGTWNALVATS